MTNLSTQETQDVLTAIVVAVEAFSNNSEDNKSQAKAKYLINLHNDISSRSGVNASPKVVF